MGDMLAKKPMDWLLNVAEVRETSVESRLVVPATR